MIDSVSEQANAGPDLKRAQTRARNSINADRLPPHSQEAEQGVLGCILQSPNGTITETELKLGRHGDAFYDLRHQTIFQHIVALHDQRIPIDLITLSQTLKSSNSLAMVGGLRYLSELPEAVPSAANLAYYLEIVAEKFTLRKIIQTCTEAVGRVYEHTGELSELLDVTQHEILKAFKAPGSSTTQEHWNLRDLSGYNVATDPNAVIGWHDGVATRYLCKGYGAWLISQSGVGKSTLSTQQAYLWALDRDFCGIRPARKPIRILIVQSENDQGDCAETTQGILDGGQFSPADFELLQERVKIIRCRGLTGREFCRWLEREAVAWRADIVYVDPLLRYAGIDVSRQDQVTRFLNEQLDPVLANTGIVMIGIHHTGKPRSKKETQGWSIYDHAYSGIGSSELVNWARAVSIIQVTGVGTFDMLLAKRGARAWATHPGSAASASEGIPVEAITTIHLRHAQGRIYWEQTDPPEFKVEEPADRSGGRPSKITEIACSNLHAFCTACKPEGEGKNEIARRLEFYLSQNKTDASISTCKRVISALVANGKLMKNEASLYFKGLQA